MTSRMQWPQLDRRRASRLSTVFSAVTKAYITIAIRQRYDYNEKLTCSFFAGVESRRMEAGARDTS